MVGPKNQEISPTQRLIPDQLVRMYAMRISDLRESNAEEFVEQTRRFFQKRDSFLTFRYSQKRGSWVTSQGDNDSRSFAGASSDKQKVSLRFDLEKCGRPEEEIFDLPLDRGYSRFAFLDGVRGSEHKGLYLSFPLPTGLGRPNLDPIKDRDVLVYII